MLPPGMRPWLEHRLGAVVVRPAPGQHGRVHTWRVEAARGPCFLRWGLSARKRQQERRVAEALWPRLPERCPQLLAVDDQGLLMTALPGHRSSAAPAARSAGQALAAVHALPLVDTDDMPLEQALHQRATQQLDRLERLGHPVPAALRGRPPAAGPRRWCHRDLQPDNWLWDGQTTRLLDWEHARPDAVALDLAKIATMPCWTDFREGYERAGGQVDAPALAFAVALHGAATLSWGHSHGDAAFIAEGLRVLALCAP